MHIKLTEALIVHCEAANVPFFGLCSDAVPGVGPSSKVAQLCQRPNLSGKADPTLPYAHAFSWMHTSVLPTSVPKDNDVQEVCGEEHAVSLLERLGSRQCRGSAFINQGASLS